MNLRRIVIMLCLAATAAGCRSVPGQQVRPDLSVTIHRPTVHSMISDVSQRDSHPQRSVRQNPDGSFTVIDPTEGEIENWKKKYTAPVDLIVRITNASTHELELFEEWNSWGYCNLKFVFSDSFHEYWVVKQPGLWYRNFPSWHTLASGESFEIPVAFSDPIWSGLDQIRANTNQITWVRALYEQYQVVPMFGGVKDVWRGSVSSCFRSAAELIPRFGFLPSEQMLDEEVENQPMDITPPDFSAPDDVKIDITK